GLLGPPGARRAGPRGGPGGGPRREMAVTDDSPPPSRWALRTIRATFDCFRAMTPSGVWRSLERQGVGLRSAAVQHYSPDPEYIPKCEKLYITLANKILINHVPAAYCTQGC